MVRPPVSAFGAERERHRANLRSHRRRPTRRPGRSSAFGIMASARTAAAWRVYPIGSSKGRDGGTGGGRRLGAGGAASPCPRRVLFFTREGRGAAACGEPRKLLELRRPAAHAGSSAGAPAGEGSGGSQGASHGPPGACRKKWLVVHSMVLTRGAREVAQYAPGVPRDAWREW